jgi:hypothetical protein
MGRLFGTLPYAGFTLSPFHWDPVTGDLQVWTQLHEVIETPGALHDFVPIPKTKRDACARLVSNWDAIPPRLPVPALSDGMLYYTVESGDSVAVRDSVRIVDGAVAAVATSSPPRAGVRAVHSVTTGAGWSGPAPSAFSIPAAGGCAHCRSRPASRPRGGTAATSRAGVPPLACTSCACRAGSPAPVPAWCCSADDSASVRRRRAPPNARSRTRCDPQPPRFE